MSDRIFALLYVIQNGDLSGDELCSRCAGFFFLWKVGTNEAPPKKNNWTIFQGSPRVTHDELHCGQSAVHNNKNKMTNKTVSPQKLGQVWVVFFILSFILGELLLLSYKLFLPGKIPPNDPLIVTFFIVPIACSLFAATGTILYSLQKTRNRKSDPYRFSVYQYRFLVLPKERKEVILKKISELGFKESSSSEDSDWSDKVFKSRVQDESSVPRDQIFRVLFEKGKDQGRVILGSYKDTPRRPLQFDIDNYTFKLLVS